MKPVSVLVCGSRDWTDYAYICEVLDRLYAVYKFDLIIHGDSGKYNSRHVAVKGVDCLAGRWCVDRGVQQVILPANWTGLGDAAGMRRNRLMHDWLHPDLVVAFSGGVGTANMMRIAYEGGTPVFDVEDDATVQSLEDFISANF